MITHTLPSGTLLIADGSVLPASLRYDCEPLLKGWGKVKDLDGKALDQIIGRAGWNFFFIAGAIEMIAFGRDENLAAGKALKRITASLKAQKFNCLEITRVAAKRFLGFPYVEVAVHLRHIQKGKVLFAD